MHAATERSLQAEVEERGAAEERAATARNELSAAIGSSMEAAEERSARAFDEVRVVLGER